MPRNPESFPTSVRLPADIRRWLRQESKKQGCSQGFKIVEILKERYQQWLSANNYPTENTQ